MLIYFQTNWVLLPQLVSNDQSHDHLSHSSGDPLGLAEMGRIRFKLTLVKSF